jgi:hypothetical protein
MLTHLTDRGSESPGKLAALRRDFGTHWQIEQQAGSLTWEAVARPAPSQVIVYVARDLDALRVKLEAGQFGAADPAAPRDGVSCQRLQALEDALKYRRARIAEPCADCAAAPGDRCEDHASDVDLVTEYETTARQLLQAAR